MGRYFLLQMLSTLTIVYSFDPNIHDITQMLDIGMDYKQNPCENFYDYVCGNWAEKFPKPNYHSIWNSDEITKDIIINKVKDILEGPNNDRKLFSIERQFYNACMNTGHSFNEGKILYTKMVAESSLPGTSWQNVAKYYALKTGEISLFHISLNYADKLQILRPQHTGTNKKSFEELDMNFIDTYLRNNPDDLWFNQYRPSDFSFQTEFKEFIKSVNELVHGPELPLISVSIRELEEIYDTSCTALNSRSEINWFSFLQALSGETSIPLTDSYHIDVDWSYLGGLCEILSDTPNEVIERYLNFNFETLENMILLINDFATEVSHAERSARCIVNIPITDEFYNVLANDESHLNEEILNLVIENLKADLESDIKNSLLDGPLIETVLNWARGIRLEISKQHLPFIRNETDSASSFTVTPVALQNWINFKKARTNYKFFLSFTHTQEEIRRRKRSIKMNAYYMLHENIIVMSPAFLFPPFFFREAPLAYNFGRLAFAISHQIYRAFDIITFPSEYRHYFQNETQWENVFWNYFQCMTIRFNQIQVIKGTSRKWYDQLVRKRC
ncbi:endothelin-converting enzyme 2-like isoform X2 [Leptopilina heterotoma]|uniref:endothelin-converting enzyme 2-like isoform X2 n=1 Tax=Leptopilina heterotoma TaxID=63436 RepID=UPI001CA985ED|nr:endothelin-converting enzyme 2-like isoform X2 [Leptopilina heterotoma]